MPEAVALMGAIVRLQDHAGTDALGGVDRLQADQPLPLLALHGCAMTEHAADIGLLR